MTILVRQPSRICKRIGAIESPAVATRQVLQPSFRRRVIRKDVHLLYGPLARFQRVPIQITLHGHIVTFIGHSERGVRVP